MLFGRHRYHWLRRGRTLEKLDEVLHRLQEQRIRLKKVNCKFLQKSIVYLGHKIDAQGMHAADSKVEALLQIPKPQGVTELFSCLGMINYYGKYLFGILPLFFTP